MGWGYYDWRPYVPVAQRQASARKKIAQMLKKSGRAAQPVELPSRKIATTFWGKSWCDNLEAYSDFANRLPRGRTYVRNGSVMDLQIEKGSVSALVSGSELYRIKVNIKPLNQALWQGIQKECAGKIDSLIELLQGKLSSAVMQVVTRQEKGLFPTPKEIGLDCSCPDWAELCKHVAAVLYGVGARLDEKPELLFLLRGVDPAELISKVSAAEAVRQTSLAPAEAAIAETELADVFGIEVETRPAAAGLAQPPGGSATASEPAAQKAVKPPKPKGKGRKKTAGKRPARNRKPKGKRASRASAGQMA